MSNTQCTYLHNFFSGIKNDISQLDIRPISATNNRYSGRDGFRVIDSQPFKDINLCVPQRSSNRLVDPILDGRVRYMNLDVGSGNRHIDLNGIKRHMEFNNGNRQIDLGNCNRQIDLGNDNRYIRLNSNNKAKNINMDRGKNNCGGKMQMIESDDRQNMMSNTDIEDDEEYLDDAVDMDSSTSEEINNKNYIEDEDEIINTFIQCLKKNKIYLVCFDFDSTIVNTDYNPEFFDPNNVCKRITPLFYKIVRLLLSNKIDVSIVTFNLNPNIQRAMLSMKLPIKVFAREDSSLSTGKGWHLDNAMHFYNIKYNIDDRDGIRPSNILFIDDDPNNIEIAVRAGYRCINNPDVFTLNDLVMFMNGGSV